MPRLGAFCLLLWTVPLIASAQSPLADASTAEAPIRKLVKEYVSAREASDGSAIGALFTSDADQLVSTGEWRRGRNDLVAGTLKSSRKEQGRRTITVQTVRFVSPDVAIVDGHYDVTGSGAAARHMWTTLFCRQEEGRWKIAAIRNMLPAAP